MATLTACACQSCANVCTQTLCAAVPLPPDQTCASCAREVCYADTLACDADSVTAGTGGSSGTGGVSTGTGGSSGTDGAGGSCSPCYDWYYASAMYDDLCAGPSTGYAESLSYCVCGQCPVECTNFCAPLQQGAGFPTYGFIEDSICSACVLQTAGCEQPITSCTSN